MRKTPQQFRRDNVKKLHEKVLQENKLTFVPLSISTHESIEDDFTTVDLSFSEESLGSKKLVQLRGVKSNGFVDGLFLGLYNNYVQNYSSLSKLKLVDLMVNPIMKASTKRGSDAKTSVIFRVEVDGHGLSEFQHESRSMIYSSFVSALEVFQFYINCERAFKKIKLVIDDAQARNRGDIIQGCLTDLSMLTEVNTYAK